MLTIFDVIVGVLFGLTIFELLYWMATLAFSDSKKDIQVDQEFKDYLEHITSAAVRQRSSKDKKD